MMRTRLCGAAIAPVGVRGYPPPPTIIQSLKKRIDDVVKWGGEGRK